MSDLTMRGPSNGHVSSDDEMASKVVTEPPPNDGELSDMSDVPDRPSPRSPFESTDAAPHIDDASHESEESDNDNPSEDADFDKQPSPESELDDVPNARRSSSIGSSTSSKRKAHVDDDDYMRANPELYGLRRSVRCSTRHVVVPSCWLIFVQTRPRESRRIVSTSTCADL